MKDVQYVVHNRGGPCGSLAFRLGEFLHLGWFYTPFSGDRAHHFNRQVPPGPAGLISKDICVEGRRSEPKPIKQ